MNRRKLIVPAAFALLLANCEKPTSPGKHGPSRFRYTFAGTVHRMLGNDTARVQSLGIRVGSPVTYTFLVDTLLPGFIEYKGARTPEKDSRDVPGRRPWFYFDSLETPPLNPRRPQEAVQMRYAGHRLEEAGGYAGTFFTHDYIMDDSTLNVAVCFNDSVGGPLLPKVGDAATGTEHFYYISTQAASTVQSSLEVISVESVPDLP